MKIKKIQKLLSEQNIDGWLFYDFHNRDHIAYRILGLDFKKTTSRRWFYFVPKEGNPVKIISKVEPERISSLEGESKFYLSRLELYDVLKQTLVGHKKIAMQYSPMNDIPYISLVDGGTIDLIRSFGVEIVSSAELVQILESVIDENGFKLHIKAGKIVDKIREGAFKLIGESIKNNEKITDYEVQQWILSNFQKNDLTCDGDFPIVAVNENAANPHFSPSPDKQVPIKKGDRVLIDLWARFNRDDGIYYDITWCGYVGENVPEDYEKIFGIVTQARDKGVSFIKEKFEKGEDCYGFEVDEVVRKVITDAGYGNYFTHRTGHSIGREVHGNGVNIDSLETKDNRKLINGTCFSIEPGIYIPGGIGVRSEINVFIKDHKPIVTGEVQKEIVKIKV